MFRFIFSKYLVIRQLNLYKQSIFIDLPHHQRENDLGYLTFVKPFCDLLG